MPSRGKTTGNNNRKFKLCLKKNVLREILLNKANWGRQEKFIRKTYFPWILKIAWNRSKVAGYLNEKCNSGIINGLTLKRQFPPPPLLFRKVYLTCASLVCSFFLFTFKRWQNTEASQRAVKGPIRKLMPVCVFYESSTIVGSIKEKVGEK